MVKYITVISYYGYMFILSWMVCDDGYNMLNTIMVIYLLGRLYLNEDETMYRYISNHQAPHISPHLLHHNTDRRIRNHADTTPGSVVAHGDQAALRHNQRPCATTNNLARLTRLHPTHYNTITVIWTTLLPYV